MTVLKHRDWVPAHCEDRVQQIAADTRRLDSGSVADRIEALAAENRVIHEKQCFNLNPATNVMNPRAVGRHRQSLWLHGNLQTG